MVHDEYTKNIHKGSFMSASCNALVAMVALIIKQLAHPAPAGGIIAKGEALGH